MARLVVLALALVACTPAPRLDLQLVTDLAPGREFDEVTITVLPEGETRVVRADASRGWGRGVRLASIEGLPEGSREIRATLRLAGVDVQTQQRRVLTTASSTTVTILITRDCTGVVCSPDQACLGAQCVSAECTVENPAGCPSTRSCSAGSCGAPSGCVVPECRPEGFCFAAPDDARCSALEVCDALLGCVAVGPLDAGALDAELPDAPAPPEVTATFLFPWNGALTSTTPELVWIDVPTAITYQVVVDDSCDPFAFPSCDFPSPELDTMVSGTSVVVPALPVSAVRPVGRRYFARVRACADAGCTTWSPVRYFEAGRAHGDVNGDGFSDAIIGAPTGVGGGAAYVLYGGQDPAVALSAPVLLPASAIPADADDELGRSVAFVGDVNVDGFADFAVGAPRGDSDIAADVGVVHLFFGNAAAAPLSAPFARQELAFGGAGSRFGASVAGVGDVDRDGRPDLAIGAPAERAVYVLFGADLDTEAHTRLPAPTGVDTAFGSSIAYVAERSTVDFAAFLVAGGGSPGLVHRYGLGSATGPPVELGFPSSTRMESLDRFGASMLATCDVDGDGRNDVMVGASGYRGVGAVGIFFDFIGAGPTAWIDPPDDLPGDLGETLACADLDGDGVDDLLVGSPLASRVYFYPGGSRAPTLPPTGTLTGGSTFGTAVATGFDFDGDGHADTLYGEPGSRSIAVEIGARAAPLTLTGVIASPSADLGDGFGTSIAIAPR